MRVRIHQADFRIFEPTGLGEPFCRGFLYRFNRIPGGSGHTIEGTFASGTIKDYLYTSKRSDDSVIEVEVPEGWEFIDADEYYLVNRNIAEAEIEPERIDAAEVMDRVLRGVDGFRLIG